MKLQPDVALESAETIALRALAFLAADDERLARFLALSGMGPGDLRANAREPHMLHCVLDHLMQDETLLMVFSTEAGLKPQSVAEAHRILAGPPTERSV